MTAHFAKVIASLIDREGGYVHHLADRGGETCWGITEAVARANGWQGDMRDLPRHFAEMIYENRYIRRPGFDKVTLHSPLIAEELVDTGVNMGPATAATFFQRWLNVFNRQQRDYGDLFVDGQVGPVTIAALKAFLAKRGDEGENVLFAALNCLQGTRYLEIAEARPDQETFVFGWLRGRVDLMH